MKVVCLQKPFSEVIDECTCADKACRVQSQLRTTAISQFSKGIIDTNEYSRLVKFQQFVKVLILLRQCSMRRRPP